MKSWIAAVVLASVLISPSAASAQALASVLQTTFDYEGQSYVFEDGVVPLLPSNACYTWYVQLPDADAPVSVVERFRLPSPLAAWANLTTTAEGSRIEEGGRVAVTAFSTTTNEDGWLSHGWCAAEGDPIGPHSIRVTANGAVVADFNFRVVSPQDYAFPEPTPVVPASPPMEAKSRSAIDSW